MSQRNITYMAARSSYLAELSETRNDFFSSVTQWRLALSLALHDIASRYRGSILGPWWITLTMGALVLGIGINYAALFHVAVATLLPYVAIGIVMWGYINSCIVEGGDAFISGGAMLRQSALPLPLFLLRCLLRNMINLGHHLIIILAVMLYFGKLPTLGILWSISGFLLTSLNIGWVMVLVAFLSARFRDVPQIISAVLQIAFFLTPVIWQATPQLSESIVVKYNPLHYSLDAIRAPLLGDHLPAGDYVVLGISALIGWVLAVIVYNFTRRRVVHYL